jgi:DNA invertase Pin-like site-specific DNA recombinase
MEPDAEPASEGIDAAKVRGVYKGRTPTVDPARIRQLAADGLGATAICKQLGVSRTTVYRLLGEPTGR